MKKLTLCFGVICSFSCLGQNQAKIYRQAASQSLFLNVSNNQQNFNVASNLSNDNNNVTRSQHLFTKAQTQPLPSNPAPQRSQPVTINTDSRGRGNNIQVQADNNNNIEVNDFDPQSNLENNDEQVVQQQAAPQQQITSIDISLPQIKMPVVKFSSGSSSSGSGHSSFDFKKAWRKKILKTKRKVQRSFSHGKKQKSNPVSCFNWSKNGA